MIKIGVSSWTYPYAIGNRAYEVPKNPLGALGLAEKAIKAGAEALQIADNLPLHLVKTSELDALATLAKAQDLRLEVGTAGLREDNLLNYLSIATRLGAKLVRTLPHQGEDKPSLEEAKRRVEAVLPRYIKAGVVLGIENHDYYKSAWIAELVSAFNSPALGVCLDALNNLALCESFREVMKSLAPLAVNFHCKDFDIKRKPSGLGFDVNGTPAGEGMMDLDLAWRSLPDGISWILESWLPWQGSLEATLQMEDDWVKRGLSNLKAFRKAAEVASE